MASGDFKIGSQHEVALDDLLRPLVGRIVSVDFADHDEPLNCRITEVSKTTATIKVVPPSVRE
jgi:hypothetical protein